VRGRALIIATSKYSEATLSALQSTQIDAEGLSQALSDRRIGDFSVTQCLNAPCQTWREQIEELFADAKHEESLLLYISGHAIKDRDGRLYFAASDTRLNRLIATGVASTLIQDASNNSRSQRIAMIFDTCFSGAFAKGMAIKADWRNLNAGDYFHDGSGKVIITASDALQYALAGDSIDGGSKAHPSAFSRHLIEGLKSGDADMDDDGQVTTDDIYRYISTALRREGAQQRPQRWSFGVTQDFILATNPAPKPGKLPGDIVDLISDSRSAVRYLSVEKLKGLLTATHLPLALAARHALEQLRDDDSRAIATAAAAALGSDAALEKSIALLPRGQPPIWAMTGETKAETSEATTGIRGQESRGPRPSITPDTPPKMQQKKESRSLPPPTPASVERGRNPWRNPKKWKLWIKRVLLFCVILVIALFFIGWCASGSKVEAPAPAAGPPAAQ
jgi:hypothetical protein